LTLLSAPSSAAVVLRVARRLRRIAEGFCPDRREARPEQ
jgi:hypothetical protein